MPKLKLTGYALRPGSERFLARAEVGQLNRQGVKAHRGDNWRLVRYDDGWYSLRHSAVKEVKIYALEIV